MRRTHQYRILLAAIILFISEPTVSALTVNTVSAPAQFFAPNPLVRPTIVLPTLRQPGRPYRFFRRLGSTGIGTRTNNVSTSRQKIHTSLHLFPSLSINESLVSPNDMWGNLVVLIGTATIAQTNLLGSLGRLLGAPVTAMALTFIAASCGILIPGGSPTSRALQLLTLQLATPLILLGADLRDCTKRCGPLLASFGCASLATVGACCIGWKYIIGRQLMASLGRDGLVIAAALMAKNIGGGINYIAVCRSLEASPQAIAAGLCVDNIFALIYFPATSALGTNRPDVDVTEQIIDGMDNNHRKMSVEVTSNSTQASQGETETLSHIPTTARDHNEEHENHPISVQSITSSLCISATLLWLGERIGGSIGALPATTLATVMMASQLSNYRWFRSIQPACNTIGTACLYLFFSTAGSPGIKVAQSVRSSLVPLTAFLTSLYSIHGLILWVLSRLWGKKNAAFVPQRLLVASSSAIGGPATSVALAKSLGWKSLEVPSLLVGNVGYAIATFCGLAFYKLFL